MVDKAGRVKIIDFNNCMPKESFRKVELGIVLAKKHMDLLIDPKDWDWKVDFWALGCTIYHIKHKKDIIDDFLTHDKITYAELDTCTDNAKLRSARIRLHNFYLRKLKIFKQTEQIVYACLRSTVCAKLAKYLDRYRSFHDIPRIDH